MLLIIVSLLYCLTQKFIAMKRVYRILTADYRIKFTGTTQGSWFTLEEAKKLVDYSKGEMIYRYSDDYMDMLHEVL